MDFPAGIDRALCRIQQFRRRPWPGGKLFVTGHDARELYVLSRPPTAVWNPDLGGDHSGQRAGQAFAWDASEPGTLYAIERKTREVIVSRITRCRERTDTAGAGPDSSARKVQRAAVCGNWVYCGISEAALSLPSVGVQVFLDWRRGWRWRGASSVGH